MSNHATPEPIAPRRCPALPAVRTSRAGLPLLVLTLGTALFALAAWAPWWVYINLMPTVPPVYQFNPGRASNVVPLRFLPPAWVFPVWSILSVLGILLAGLFWIWKGPWFVQGMLASIALWATLVTVITIAFWLFVATGGYPSIPASHNISHGLHPEYPAYGLWLALGALVLIWIGVLALLRAQRRRASARQLR